MHTTIDRPAPKHGWTILLVTLGLSLLITSSTQAQVQTFLNARSPFVWDGLSAHTLMGAEETSLAISSASIVNGLYGELQWDIKGLLGSENNIEAKVPSFLFKYIPIQSDLDASVGHITTLSIGTRALSGIDAYAGWGTYLDGGRFALGAGLNIAWDEQQNGELSSEPEYSWIFRNHTQLSPALGVDVAAILPTNGDRPHSDVAVVYKVLGPNFHVYVAFMDTFSNRVERRIGLSYAIGI